MQAEEPVVTPQSDELDAEAVLTKLDAKQGDLQASAVDLFGEAVSAAKKLPAKKRKPILDIYQATIPDPEGFGLLPMTAQFRPSSELEGIQSPTMCFLILNAHSLRCG